MNFDQLRNYCLEKKGSFESLPFDDVSLVFKVMNKIFAIIALDMDNQMSLKCNPDYALELRASYPDHILPARYMNKQYWNMVKTKGFDDEQLLFKLIDHSYNEVVKQLPLRSRKILAEIK